MSIQAHCTSDFPFLSHVSVPNLQKSCHACENGEMGTMSSHILQKLGPKSQYFWENRDPGSPFTLGYGDPFVKLGTLYMADCFPRKQGPHLPWNMGSLCTKEIPYMVNCFPSSS